MTWEAISGWEGGTLSWLSEGPRVYCYPGFMGSICESLVVRGLASRESAGMTEKPHWWNDRRGAFEPSPQFRYAITEAGWAQLKETA